MKAVIITDVFEDGKKYTNLYVGSDLEIDHIVSLTKKSDRLIHVDANGIVKSYIRVRRINDLNVHFMQLPPKFLDHETDDK